MTTTLQHTSTTRQSLGGCYRQGDILLVPCEEIPVGLPVEPAEQERVVLARGETTGHAHTMPADRVSYFREDGTGRGYIRVHGGAAELTHEEHSPLSIDPGNYRLIQQREYQPRAMPRTVTD